MQLRKREVFLFIALILYLYISHFKAIEAGFVTDFTGLWAKMQGNGFYEALQSFGFPSLMPLLNVFYLLLYKVFGLNGQAWFLFFAVFYALGVCFFYRSILELLPKEQGERIALAVVALIMVSPFQVEAMIWKVGLGHISSVSFFMMATYFGLIYLKRGSKRALVLQGVGLMASLLCFEWALVFPVVLLLFAMYLSSRRLVTAMGLSLLIIAVYLLLTKLSVGRVIGHYDIALSQILDIPKLLGTAYKYLVKHIGLVHYYPSGLKSMVYGLGDKLWWQLIVGISTLVAVILTIRKKHDQSHLLTIVWLCSLICLLLVLPLYFHSLLFSENDRYGSLFVPFISLFIVLLIDRIKKLYAYIIFSTYLITNIYFQQKMISYWSDGQEIVEQLTHSFPEDLAGRTLLLNLPENYKGTFMFRDFSGGNPFVDHSTMYGRDYNNIDLVAQYNVPFKEQALFLKDSGFDNLIKLEFKDWGSWWWKSGQGAVAYENDIYKVDFKDKFMELTLKDLNYYNQLLYTDGSNWKKIDVANKTTSQSEN